MLVLVALAYLEEDGLPLSLALTASAISLVVTGGEIWVAIGAAHWIGQL